MIVNSQDLVNFRITDEEFSVFQNLIHKHTGIFLSNNKKILLVSRLTKRLKLLGCNSFSSYHKHIKKDSTELTYLFNLISTNETQFFREPQQFDFLQKHIFPKWMTQAKDLLRPKRLQIWSAACATGEEPYSLAMMLLEHFPPTAGWEISILATDISTDALEKATTATWPIEKASQIPEKYLKRFMLKGVRSQEGKMTAGIEIRNIIDFLHLNLNDKNYPIRGVFDLILCRNVLIYFSQEAQIQVINNLLSYLSPTGYFFLGHAESLHGLTQRMHSIAPTIYTFKNNLQT